MSDNKKIRFIVKAMINKEKTRVLFAEVDNNFADILLRFSTLPLGLVIQAFLKHFGDELPGIGCLNNLYKDFKKLYHNIDEELHSGCTLHNTSLLHGFPSGNEMYCLALSKCYNLEKEYFCFSKIFSQNSSFIILDDLSIVDNGKGSFLENFKSVGIVVADMDGAEARDVAFGVNDIMDFLVLLLVSPSPLMDIILGTDVNSEEPEPEASGISLQNFEINSASSDDKMMVLKLTLQKSTNKLLFAQADHVFVNCLFSVLLIPLGRVDCRLGSDTSFKNIDTLLTSVIDFSSKYLSDVDLKSTEYTYKTLFGDGRYMISDDLSVTCVSLISGVSLLDELKITLSDVEEVDLQIGVDEVLSILKASLTSTRALTDGLLIPRLKK